MRKYLDRLCALNRLVTHCLGRRGLAAVAILLVSISSTIANDRVFDVGTCPHPITVNLDGKWADAQSHPLVLEALAANSARKAAYVASYTLGDHESEPTWVAVGSLGSLEKYQGRLTENDLGKLSEQYKRYYSNIPKWVNDYIRTISKESKYIKDIESFNIHHLDIYDDSINVYGVIFADTINGFVGRISLQRLVLVKNCIISLQFSSPIGLYAFDDLREIATDVSLH